MYRSVGLTGGIATGKSTVTRILREHFGVPVIDADQIAHEIVRHGKPGYQPVVEYFGRQILGDDGEIVRARLRELVQDDDARHKLESLLHWLIFDEIRARQQWIDIWIKPRIIVVDVPLLFETASQRRFDTTVLVTCSPMVQRDRLMTRNGWSQEMADFWINTQMPLARKCELADHILENVGTLDELITDISSLLDTLLRKE